MFPLSARVTLGFLALTVVVACGADHPSGGVVDQNTSTTGIPLAQLVSGYAGTVPDWRAFLLCASQRAQAASLRIEVGTPGLPDATMIALGEAQKRLRAELPRSFRDFVMATSGHGLLIRSTGQAFGAVLNPREEMLGYSSGVYDYQIFPIGVILPFKESRTFAEPWVRYVSSGNQRISDLEYYRYGFAANGEAIYSPPHYRPEYLPNAIFVGGSHVEGTHVLLNPHVRSSDGEWEVMEWSAANGGYLRFRTFAEYMRDTIIAYVEKRDWLTPRPPADIAGSCAELLPMKNVSRKKSGHDNE